MTTTINASTSSGLVVTPDNSGNVLLQYNGVAAPAFYYTATTSVSLPTNTYVKLPYVNKIFDTNNNVSNSRFTPTVAGYYQINATAANGGTLTSPYVLISIFKNGTTTIAQGSGVSSGYSFNSISGLFYANGTTDYFEVYYQQASGSTYNSDTGTYAFSGCLLRGA